MSTRSFKTWSERIDSGTFTKAACRQFSAAVYPTAAGLRAGGMRINITQDEALSLVKRLNLVGVRLTQEHTEQGWKWLNSRDGRKLGLPGEVFTDFSHFTYHGHTLTYGWSGGLPVWRINLNDGRAIDYWWSAWQVTTDLADLPRWEWAPPESTVEMSKGRLGPDGRLEVYDVKAIKHSDIARCPQYIWLGEHYRDDGTCRCDEGSYNDDGDWVPNEVQV